jgi:hypothetical protein
VGVISYFAENPLGSLAIDREALSDGFVSFCYPAVNRKLKLEEREGSKLDGRLPKFPAKFKKDKFISSGRIFFGMVAVIGYTNFCRF